MKKIILSLIISISIFACKKKEISPVLNNEINTYSGNLIDTFSISSSIILDNEKIFTKNKATHTVGQYKDSQFGIIVSEAFIQLADKNIFKLGDIGDSAFLRLDYNDMVWGDSTKPFTLEIYETTESFDENEEYQASSSLNIAGQVIGMLNFTPTPHQDASISIKLNQQFALNYIQKDIDNSFVGKGICIKASDGTNASIISFKESSSELVFYKHNNTDTTVKKISLNTNFDFDYYIADKSMSKISALIQHGDGVASSVANDKMLLQSGLGIGTKIEIDGLKQFLIDNPKIQIVNAELILHLDPSTTGGNNTIPPLLLQVSEPNGNLRSRNSDEELNGLILPDDVLFSGSQNGFFVYDESKLEYKISFTSHLRSIVLDKEKDFEGFILYPTYSALSNSSKENILHNAVLFNENNLDANKKPQLKVFYTLTNE